MLINISPAVILTFLKNALKLLIMHKKLLLTIIAIIIIIKFQKKISVEY